MSIAEYHYRSYYCCFIVFGFIIGLQAIQSLVLDYSISARYGFLLKEKALSQIRQWSATHTSATIALAYLQARQIVGRKFCNQVGPNFSLGSPAQYCSSPNRLEHGVKAQHRHRLDFSMFSELRECYPRQWGPFVSLQRVTFCPTNSLGFWGISMGPSGPTTQLNLTQFYHWKPCLETKRGPGENLYPPLLAVFIRVTFIDFRNFSLCWVSTQPPIPTVSACTLSLHPISPTPDPT